MPPGSLYAVASGNSATAAEALGPSLNQQSGIVVQATSGQAPRIQNGLPSPSPNKRPGRRAMTPEEAKQRRLRNLFNAVYNYQEVRLVYL
ncbi:unnamed protein product [Protopolystoma xenopodis]|uniref:Uncharacterized protein n=1 Tax=Protopolystoma xenopodis TaxID=117903 RepID=A0A3S5FFI3_9PLAT|nr:unnamed protein product [Protopolystoma xenopodis]